MTDWENVVNERLIESVLVESCGAGWGGGGGIGWDIAVGWRG